MQKTNTKGIFVARHRPPRSSTNARPPCWSCDAWDSQPTVSNRGSCWWSVLRVRIQCRSHTCLRGRRHTRWCCASKSYSTPVMKVDVIWPRTFDMVRCACLVLYAASPSLVYRCATLEAVVRREQMSTVQLTYPNSYRLNNRLEFLKDFPDDSCGLCAPELEFLVHVLLGVLLSLLIVAPPVNVVLFMMMPPTVEAWLIRIVERESYRISRIDHKPSDSQCSTWCCCADGGWIYFCAQFLVERVVRQSFDTSNKWMTGELFVDLSECLVGRLARIVTAVERVHLGVGTPINRCVLAVVVDCIINNWELILTQFPVTRSFDEFHCFGCSFCFGRPFP